MGEFIKQLAQQGLSLATGGISTAINSGLGILFGRSQEQHNDARQLAMQQKLQEMQEAGQKRMTDYNYGKQLEMWNATSYPAQMEMIKKAGLNPAMMYGIGGGGGQTANVNTGNVSAGEAPKGGHETLDYTGMGIQMQQQAMQLQLLRAQKENIEADTANKQAGATFTGGAQTQSTYQGIEESKARQQLLEQNLDNERQRFEIGKLNITLQNIINYEQQASQKDRLDYITYQTRIALKQLENVTNEAYVNQATRDSKVEIIKREAIGAAIRNGLMQAQTAETNAETKKRLNEIFLDNAKIKEITNNIMMNWDRISQTNKDLDIKNSYMQNETDPVNQALDRIFGSLHSLIHVFPETGNKRSPIGFKY